MSSQTIAVAIQFLLKTSCHLKHSYVVMHPQCNTRKLSRALTIPKRPAGKDREENRKIAKKEKERLAAMDKLVGE